MVIKNSGGSTVPLAQQRIVGTAPLGGGSYGAQVSAQSAALANAMGTGRHTYRALQLGGLARNFVEERFRNEVAQAGEQAEPIGEGDAGFARRPGRFE